MFAPPRRDSAHDDYNEKMTRRHGQGWIYLALGSGKEAYLFSYNGEKHGIATNNQKTTQGL